MTEKDRQVEDSCEDMLNAAFANQIKEQKTFNYRLITQARGSKHAQPLAVQSVDTNTNTVTVKLQPFSNNGSCRIYSVSSPDINLDELEQLLRSFSSVCIRHTKTWRIDDKPHQTLAVAPAVTVEGKDAAVDFSTVAEPKLAQPELVEETEAVFTSSEIVVEPSVADEPVVIKGIETYKVAFVTVVEHYYRRSYTEDILVAELFGKVCDLLDCPLPDNKSRWWLYDYLNRAVEDGLIVKDRKGYCRLNDLDKVAEALLAINEPAKIAQECSAAGQEAATGVEEGLSQGDSKHDATQGEPQGNVALSLAYLQAELDKVEQSIIEAQDQSQLKEEYEKLSRQIEALEEKRESVSDKMSDRDLEIEEMQIKRDALQGSISNVKRLQSLGIL